MSGADVPDSIVRLLKDGQMQLFPLSLYDGHLFATVGGDDWLVDTGAPTSFGDDPSLHVGERTSASRMPIWA